MAPDIIQPKRNIRILIPHEGAFYVYVLGTMSDVGALLCFWLPYFQCFIHVSSKESLMHCASSICSNYWINSMFVSHIYVWWISQPPEGVLLRLYDLNQLINSNSFNQFRVLNMRLESQDLIWTPSDDFKKYQLIISRLYELHVLKVVISKFLFLRLFVCSSVCMFVCNGRIQRSVVNEIMSQLCVL